jgi:hypothetical protein
MTLVNDHFDGISDHINQLVVAGRISTDEAETLQQHADLLRDQLEDAYDREHGKYHTSGQGDDDHHLAPDL